MDLSAFIGPRLHRQPIRREGVKDESKTVPTSTGRSDNIWKCFILIGRRMNSFNLDPSYYGGESSKKLQNFV